MLKLHPYCIPVKGYTRSIIYDLEHGDYHLIPNSLHLLLIKKKIDSWKRQYTIKNNVIIDEYLFFLMNKKLLIECDDYDYHFFQPINLDFERPEYVSNVSIDLGEYVVIQIDRIINAFVELGIKNIAINQSTQNIEHLLWFVSHLNSTFINNIEIYFNSLILDNEELINIAKLNTSISKFIFFNSPNDFEYSLDNVDKIKVVHIKANNTIASQKRLFIINKDFFCESLHFNTFFNSRVYINHNGDIYNSKNQDFICNIVDYNFEFLINSVNLSKFWRSTKDKCLICMDCEFRYMCYDSRIPIKQANNYSYMEEECTYNPYITLWQGQKGYITVKEWQIQNPEWEKGLKRYPYTLVNNS